MSLDLTSILFLALVPIVLIAWIGIAANGRLLQSIKTVLRTGGSSAIPAFIDLLGNRFGRQRLKELNLLTTIVGGLAVKGHELNQA
jgi:molecular chaperone DnaK (HSP70)